MTGRVFVFLSRPVDFNFAAHIGSDRDDLIRDGRDGIDILRVPRLLNSVDMLRGLQLDDPRPEHIDLAIFRAVLEPRGDDGDAQVGQRRDDRGRAQQERGADRVAQRGVHESPHGASDCKTCHGIANRQGDPPRR